MLTLYLLYSSRSSLLLLNDCNNNDDMWKLFTKWNGKKFF